MAAVHERRCTQRMKDNVVPSFVCQCIRRDPGKIVLAHAAQVAIRFAGPNVPAKGPSTVGPAKGASETGAGEADDAEADDAEADDAEADDAADDEETSPPPSLKLLPRSVSDTLTSEEQPEDEVNPVGSWPAAALCATLAPLPRPRPR